MPRTTVRFVDGALVTNNPKAFEACFYMPEQLPTDDGMIRMSSSVDDVRKEVLP